MSHMNLREAVMDSPLTLQQIVSRICEEVRKESSLHEAEPEESDDAEEYETSSWRRVEVRDLCRWMSGRRTPPTPVKMELARILDWPVDELFPEWAYEGRTRGAAWRVRDRRSQLRVIRGGRE